MARLIESVVGHEEQIERLRALKASGRWPHAMLFVGPSGIGKKKTALAFAQMLVCSEAPEACGLCGPCLRMAKQQSESLIVVQPDPEAARPAIKVDDIRNLLDQLSLAGMGIARVVIIDQADTMNAQASNALLKTLEEPFENVYFILLGREVQSFLPTIRSRSQVLRFTSLTESDLRRIKPGEAEWAYKSSRGQLDQLEVLTSKEGIAKREEALALFEQFCTDPEFLLWSEWKNQLKERTQAAFHLKCWLQVVRDLIVLKTQAKQFILNSDQTERFKKLYQIQSRKLSELSQNLLSAEQSLKGNADTILLFESLWVKYARVD